MFPRSFTDVPARSSQPPRWAKSMRLLPFPGVSGAFHGIQAYVDSILELHETPTPQLLRDRTGSENYRQTERGQYNDHVRLSRSWPNSTVPSRPTVTRRDLFILIFHLEKGQGAQPPDQPAEEGLQVMHSLILGSITCVSRLLIKLKKSLITSFERELLIECL
jgi:hypothetical protein